MPIALVVSSVGAYTIYEKVFRSMIFLHIHCILKLYFAASNFGLYMRFRAICEHDSQIREFRSL